MTIKKISTLALLLLVTIFSCKKDTEDFIVTDDDEKHNAKIVGIILDENKLPLEGAVASFNGASTTTDRFGIYEFDNVQVGSQHNFIRLSKAGYIDGFRTFRTQQNGTLNQRTQLIKEDYSYSFNSGNGEKIVADNVSLTFPSNAIKDDNTGDNYTGTVSLSIAYIGPFDVDRMPGDLSAVDQNEELVTLTSYGMVSVNMKGEAGQKLQIKEGSTVTMTAEIPDLLQSDAPSSMPMWHFNTSTGLWEENGAATKTGNTYSAEIPHFSTWNFDIPNSAIIVSGKLTDKNGVALSNALIAPFSANGRRGGVFYTNEDGTFSTRLPANTVVDLHLSGSSCADPIQNSILKSVGGFQANADVGEVSVNSSENGVLNVSGTFLNCNGAPIQNGFLQIYNRYYTISNGSFNLPLVHCGSLPSTLTYKIFDRLTLKTTEGEVAVTSENVNLGEVRTCLDEDEYFLLECDEIGLSTLYPEIEFSDDGKEVHIKVINGAEHLILGAYFSDKVGTNTYTVHGEKYIPGDGQTWYEPRAPGTITFEKIGNTYIGTVELFLGQDSTPRTFTGSFKIVDE